MLVYLCGSIEYSPDGGRGWRSALMPFLEQELGHEVYDPARDEKKNLSDEELAGFREWKTRDLPRFQQTLRKIIDYDLDWVEQRADYLIAYWDQYAQRGAGTQGELTLAYRRGMPVFLVLGMPLGEVSGWVLGCATEVFPDFEALRARLRVRFPRARGADA